MNQSWRYLQTTAHSNLIVQAYLSDEEFEKILHVSRAEWEKLPTWQKQKLKRENKLF